MNHRKRPVVGLFAEGSRPTDPLRDDFDRLWQLLAHHCGHDIDLRVVGISKSQIVRLGPAHLTVKKGATQLIAKGQTQLIGGGDPLDVAIERLHAKERLDRVVIAFDRWRPNQLLTVEEQRLSCPMRPEVAFVLRHLSESQRLDPLFRQSAQDLLRRYESRDELAPRTRLSSLEIVFMDPMFEALFVADERTVRRALGAEKKKPKDWPRFKTRERALDKAVLDAAIHSATGKRNAYTSAKSRWGFRFLKAAAQDAALWKHPVATRVCRTLAV